MHVDWLIRLSDVLPKSQLMYSVHVDPQKRFLFFTNPKVGSTTILSTLQACVLGDHSRLSWNFDDIHDRQRSPLLTLRSFSQEEVHDLLNNPRVVRFCFVRDPFMRILSAYNDKILLNKPPKSAVLATLGHDPEDLEKDISFRDFVKAIRLQTLPEMNFHWVPQYLQLLHGKISYSHIGRMEQFERDFREILTVIFGSDGESIPIPRHVVDQERYRTEISKLPIRIRATIFNKYYWDYQLFGYEPPPLSDESSV